MRQTYHFVVALFFLSCGTGSDSKRTSVGTDDVEKHSVDITESDGSSFQTDTGSTLPSPFELVSIGKKDVYIPLYQDQKIYLSEHPNGLNIVFRDKQKVGSVRFNNGALEREAPYSYCGDSKGIFKDCKFRPGRFEIKANTYSRSDGKGKSLAVASVSIQILESRPVEESLIAEFQLVDSDQKKSLGLLESGSKLYRSGLGAFTIFVRPKIAVGSLVFSNGNIQNVAPYAVCGNRDRGDFNPCILPDGKFSLKVDAFSLKDGKGQLLGSAVFNIEILSGTLPSDPFKSFTLIDSKLKKPFRDVQNGDTVTLAENQKLTLFAEPAAKDIGSVRFNGRKIENVAPYALCGNSANGDYNPCDFQTGELTVLAEAFSAANAKGVKLGERKLTFKFAKTLGEPVFNHPPLDEGVNLLTDDIKQLYTNRNLIKTDAAYKKAYEDLVK